MAPEDEGNTPFGGEFGTLPDDERINAVFGDDEPTDEQASPEPQGEAQGQPRDELGRFASPEPAEPQEPAEEPPAAEAEEIPATEEQIEEQPAGYTFAGRSYPSQEEAERSYREMQSYVTRTRQEMSTLAQRMDERQRLQEEALAELLNQASFDRAKQDPEYAARVELARQLQPLVQQQVEPMQAALQEQMRTLEMERQKIKIDSALEPFFREHPDVAEGTQENIELARTVYELHEAWARQGLDEVLDMSDRGSLELAYECYRDPDLLVVLQNKPQLADSDRGLDYARMEARQLKGSRGGGTPQQQPGVRKVVGQRADVEVPGGKPASRPPQDEWEEVLALEAEDAKRPNPFLGSRR